MITDEQLDEIACEISATVVPLTLGLNTELHAEIQKLTNIPQDFGVSNNTILEIFLVGLFIMMRKNPNLQSPENRERIFPILKRYFTVSTVNFFFEFEDNDDLKNETAQDMDELYEIIMEGYNNYRGDISVFLFDRLKYDFNRESSTSKVKFIDENAMEKFEKTFMKIRGSILPWKKVSEEANREAVKKYLNEKGIEFNLPVCLLSNLSKAICEEFEMAELE